MHRQPKPKLNEKKACPMALSMVEPFILLKSGFSRNSNPCDAPGRDIEQIANTIMMIKSAGIIILENFSIPPFTPRITII